MEGAEQLANQPAAAWAWLNGRLGELEADPNLSVLAAWRALRSERDGAHLPGTALVNWPSDYWIAKTHTTVHSMTVPAWSIPAEFDGWPALGVNVAASGGPWSTTATNGARLAGLLEDGDRRPLRSQGDAVRHFLSLVEASSEHGDRAMAMASVVRPWLHAAFGALLTGIALTPADDDDVAALCVAEVQERIRLIDDLPLEMRRNHWLDFGVEDLYVMAMAPDGLSVSLDGPGIPRQGQGASWQHAWAWLSGQDDADALLDCVQLAGQLLVNEPMLAGLSLTVARGGDASMRALCVVRRWLMTTRVLAWLVEALQHPWREVRPQDLSTFALSALAPGWPRRSVAVSHRSAEVKPLMTGLNLWNSPYVSVDATTVPAWETNTAMVWSLFAPVPALVRVGSPRYLESEWCRRERELTEYLVDAMDFHTGRVVLDIAPPDLPLLDGDLFATTASDSAPRLATFQAPTAAFPPQTLALRTDVAVDLGTAILRAAGALRLVHALVRDPAVANDLARAVAAGVDLDLVVPTNNADGWSAYGSAVRRLEAEVARELGGASPQTPGGARHAPIDLHLSLPEGYPDEARSRDLRMAQQVPDLSDGRHDPLDVFAALEWQIAVLDPFNAEGYGDMVLVDISEASRESWSGEFRHSVGRGMTALTTSTPTWILQHAGQDAESWPGMGTQPIFTRHVADQFRWLVPVSLHPTWLLHYLAESGLQVSEALEAAIVRAVVRVAGADALDVREIDGQVVLATPGPRDFLVVPRDAFAQWIGDQG